MALHPGWEFRLWTDQDAAALVEEAFPDLAPTFRAYRYSIQRADAIRRAAPLALASPTCLCIAAWVLRTAPFFRYDFWHALAPELLQDGRRACNMRCGPPDKGALPVVTVRS